MKHLKRFNESIEEEQSITKLSLRQKARIALADLSTKYNNNSIEFISKSHKETVGTIELEDYIEDSNYGPGAEGKVFLVKTKLEPTGHTEDTIDGAITYIIKFYKKSK